MLPGVGEKLAAALYELGYGSSDDIAKAELADLASIKGISEKKAKELIEGALNCQQSPGLDVENALDEEEEGASGGLHE